MRRTRLKSAMARLSVGILRSGGCRALMRLLPCGMRSRVQDALYLSMESELKFSGRSQWPDRTIGRLPAPMFQSTDSWPGVNVIGYLRGEFGLAEAARRYSRALLERGCPVAMKSIELDLPHGWNDRSLESCIGTELPYADTLVFVNPDYLELALAAAPVEESRGRVFACWFWELEALPAAWMAAIERVDGILVASSFIESAFRKSTDKPILRAPLPIVLTADSSLTRVDFGLPEGNFIFLCMLDFHSSIERKNPFGVIDAFRAAFPPGRKDVTLLIKTSNGDSALLPLARLLAAASVDARIIVRDDRLPRADVQALQRCCDAYVSLHRAEGFGLGMAEAMASGKPVIATAWSGNLDFMGADNSLLIACTLVPITPGAYPNAADGRWAAPDHDAAAAAMRRLADDRAYARSLGERARASVAETLSPTRAADDILAWLQGTPAERLSAASSISANTASTS